MHRANRHELMAGSFLESAGLDVLLRNFSCKLGEIDLICRDGDTLVFVEVRFRSNPNFASASASVTPAKQRRLIASAQLYLQTRHGRSPPPCRFDVLAFDERRSPGEDGIQWIRNAFSL